MGFCFTDVLVLIITCIIFSTCHSNASRAKDDFKLFCQFRQKLVSLLESDKAIEDVPPYLPGKAAAINFTAMLYNIVHSELFNQEITVNMRFRYEYYDPRIHDLFDQLKDQTNYHNLTILRIHFTSAGLSTSYPFWVPRIKIQQASHSPYPIADRSGEAWLYPNGNVRVYDYLQIVFRCAMLVTDVPFDVQHCFLTVICYNCYTNTLDGWKQTGHRLLPVRFRSLSYMKAYVSSYYLKPGMRMYNNTLIELLGINIRYQPGSVFKNENMSHGDAVISFTLRRRSRHMIYYLVFPAGVIGLLSLIQYLIPVGCGVPKMNVAVTFFLSNTVFTLVLQNFIAPDSAENISAIGIYFMGLTLIQMVSCFFTAVVISCYNQKHDEPFSGPPHRLVWQLTNLVSKCVFFNVSEAIHFQCSCIKTSCREHLPSPESASSNMISGRRSCDNGSLALRKWQIVSHVLNRVGGIVTFASTFGLIVYITMYPLFTREHDPTYV